MEWCSQIQRDVQAALALEHLWMQEIPNYEELLWDPQDTADVEMVGDYIDDLISLNNDDDDDEFREMLIDLPWADMQGGANEEGAEEDAEQPFLYEVINIRNRNIRKYNVQGRDFHIRVKALDKELGYPADIR